MSAAPTWMTMFSFLALFLILPLVGLLLASLFHPRTRPIGLVVLGAGTLALCLLAVMWVTAVPSWSPSPAPVMVDSHGNTVSGKWEYGSQGEIHYTSSHTTHHKSFGFGFIGAPLLLLAIALVVIGLIKYRPAALPLIGLLGLGLFAVVFVSSRSVERVPGEVVAEVTIPTPSSSQHYDRGGEAAFEEVFGHLMEEAIPIAENPPAAPTAPAPQPLTPEAPPAEQVAKTEEAEEAPTWAEVLEANYSPLPPIAETPPAEVAEAVAEPKTAEAPLESVAASTGVSEAETAALDPPTTPPQEVVDWIHKPSEHVGNVVRRVVSEGPHATADVAYERVQPKIAAAVRDYLSEILAEEGHGHAEIPDLGALGITPRWIRENVVTDEYYLSTDTSVASGMQTVFVRLEFTPHTTDALVEAWQVNARQDRVSTVGLVASSLLATMGGLWGLIKLDTATRGYYTKRLFIGVPLAIIGGLTLLGLFVA